MGQDLSVKVMRLPLWKLVREKRVTFRDKNSQNDSVLFFGRKGEETNIVCGEVSIGLTENQ